MAEYIQNKGGFSPAPQAPALVIGASGVDIVGRLKADLEMGTSNPAHIRTSFGGVARNVAENLARLGQPVILLSAVGADLAGDQLIQQIGGTGVDVYAVLRSPNQPTGTYLGVIDPKGDFQVALDDMRAISALSPAYLRAHATLFKHASLVFVDANLSRETLRTAISLARREHLPVCADPTSITLAARLQPHLGDLAVLVPNSAEAGILCDRSVDPSKRRQVTEAAKCLVSLGVGIAIITLAHFGVCYATSETSGQISAMRTEVVDPTGGGDALTAAVLFALLNDIPLDDAIRLGVSAATLTLRYPGAVLPDLSLEKLYDELVI
jgi:pseudouridine kinase